MNIVKILWSYQFFTSKFFYLFHAVSTNKEKLKSDLFCQQKFILYIKTLKLLKGFWQADSTMTKTKYIICIACIYFYKTFINKVMND